MKQAEGCKAGHIRYSDVNAVAQNTPAFARAFGCPADAPMNPLDKCQVWA